MRFRDNNLDLLHEMEYTALQQEGLIYCISYEASDCFAIILGEVTLEIF